MPATFTLKGKVKDATMGTPIPNALVKIVGGTANFGKSAITNSSGRYKIIGVKPEKIILEAALAYKPKGQMHTVSANTTLNFSLTKI
jgi:protocatechuate 3,4-dioxygenase beta subunit